MLCSVILKVLGCVMLWSLSLGQLVFFLSSAKKGKCGVFSPLESVASGCN